MVRDAFSNCHPAVNFIFFLGAIGFCVVVQHPAYLVTGCLGAALYYLLLSGKRGWKMVLGMVPVFAVISAVNPLFNHQGERVLFTVLGRPYTLEALCYGMVIAGMLVGMLLWFGCYSAVLTSDKFICLFGSLIPAISLLLVMVLRLVPNLMRKARQIMGCRKSIGKGAGERSSLREKVADGMTVLSALTDWALEGSIITGDSMRARGYGTGRRTSFQIYRMTARDCVLLLVLLLLGGATLVLGRFEAGFTPRIHVAPLTWGLASYGAYLLVPSALHIKEALQWRISISRI